MGKVKLTLTIEEDLVAKAKAIAKQSRVSVSEMIENFFNQVQAVDNKTLVESQSFKLKGIAKSALSLKTDKQIKIQMYKDKYGL